MSFTEKNNWHRCFKDFRDSTKFGVSQHINGSQVWLDITAIIILNNTDTWKGNSRQLTAVAKKFQYAVFFSFFEPQVDASCFAKDGKKKEMLSFYIQCNILCLSFTAATILWYLLVGIL